MRLFIAINFDEETKEHLLTVQSRLRKLGRGNFSRPENLHLTLAFLGEIAPERVAVICRLMDQMTVPVLHLSFDHVGRFKRDDGDIWWIGLAPNKELLIFQKELSERLRNESFLPEGRSFSPHITLARRVVLKEYPDKNKLLEKSFSTDTGTVSLMLSERIDSKLIYTLQYAVHAEKNV
ncbi:MAG: RNA 2',3'-cyclic phosphodiesterase [Eubacteriales bacterium]|nr:RNA 2',3'-cyclic phosphodiesterase [Eubacteriales bacterium]